MSVRVRLAPFLAIVSIAIGSFLLPADGSEDPWHGLAKKIVSKSRPDSTGILVLFDDDLLEGLRSRLPAGFTVVPFGVSPHAFVAAQLGQTYREVSVATQDFTDVWVVGMASRSTGRSRAKHFADIAASMDRSLVLRDSIRTSRGMIAFSRWVDRPGGLAQRADMRRALAYADSVMARGIPKPVPITRPFTASELRIDSDSLSFYVARLADTSFYAIGGCSEVEMVFWNASERLGQMGPGVVPVLVRHIVDPSPFVRERIQEALFHATQDDRILARTAGEYLKFYDRRGRSPRDIVEAWWAKFGHYWTPADTTR